MLTTALRDIGAAPERLGSAPRPDLGFAVRCYHLRHSQENARALGAFVRRPRHFLLYRTMLPDLVDIDRVLHDAVEIERHLPPDYGDE